MKIAVKSIICLILILAFTFPVLVTDPYYQHVLIIVYLYGVSTYGLNIITGITGQLNLSHAGFVGIGAYTSALLTTKFLLSFWVALPVSMLVSSFFGFLIGCPSLRLRGVYFALTTLGFGMILFLVFDNWINVTGGPMGITGIPAPSPIKLPGGLQLGFDEKTGFYYLALLFVILSVYLNRQLFKSRLGRAMQAVRENEDLAMSVGISISKTKIIAFVFSTLLLGLSGSLFAHYFRFISPVSFSLPETFRQLTMLIVGGMGTLSGPLVGSFIFTVLPELLRGIEGFQWVVYGFILIVCVIFMPKGISGLIKERMNSSKRAIKS